MTHPPGPEGVPSVIPHDDGTHFWFLHLCDGLLLESMLPIGPGGWVYSAETDTVAPSIHCTACNTHGWWVNGAWSDC